MFCGNCGQNNPDFANVCGNCGAPLAAQSAPDTKKKAASDFTNAVKALFNEGVAFFKSNKTIGIGVIAAVVFLIVFSIFGIRNSFAINGPKDIAKTYVKAYYTCNSSKYLKCIPSKMIKEAAEYYDSVSEYKKEVKENFKDRKEDLKDKYGKNYKVKVKVLYVEKLDRDDYKDLKENCKDYYNIRISAARKVIVKYTIKGKEDKDSSIMQFYVVKVGLSWKFLKIY